MYFAEDVDIEDNDMQIRLATFNVENLFARAKVLNFAEHSTGDEKLGKIAELQSILEKQLYSAADKKKAGDLYDELRSFIGINILRSSIGFNLFRKKGSSYELVPNSSDDWLGFITFDRDYFSDTTSRMTAKVIREVDADVICINEVENRKVLDNFNSDRLYGLYGYNMLIDCKNDPRGIDVAIYSKHPIGNVRTNIFEKDEDGKNVFSRDCLEVEVLTPEGSIFVLANHLKSKSGGGDKRRRKQAEAVNRILSQKYDLDGQMVAIMGDLNDTPTSWPLQPLTTNPKLLDVLHSAKGPNPGLRWTYNYKGQLKQIDYILVSKPLGKKLVSAGIERRGMPPQDLKGTNADVTSFSEISDWKNAASDHGAVFADFDLS